MTVRTIGRCLIALLFLFVPALAMAQTPSTAVSTSGGELLKPQQLEALVSPIALYPDSLLSTVLMASTYPIEIVQAERWLTQNKGLSGDVLQAAVAKQAWDDSVKELIAAPPVLAMMSAKLDWTQKLGDAVLAQQTDVMDAVQRLRLKAQDNGKLETTPQQKVTVQQQDNRRTVVIEQASDDTVYVPAYDPGVVYGAWPYADDPPSYWGYPEDWGYSGIGAGVLAGGLWFGGGYAIGRWGSANWGWGGRVNWGNGNIVRHWPRATPYNGANFNRIGNNWQHNPAHRQGVRYNNANVQQRFGNANRRAGGTNFRGAAAAGAAGVGVGAAIHGAQRHGAANRQAQRQGAANRSAQRRTATNRPAPGRAAANRPANRAHVGGLPSARGHSGLGAAGGGLRGGGGGLRAGGGGFRGGGGGGGFRGGGGGGRGGGGGGRGGGRRSDIALKHDIVLLGRLDNGLGFYRFAYNGSNKAYVGTIAQEVQNVMPRAVVRGRDGYLRVFYDRIGVKFETYDQWVASGGHVPTGARAH